MTHGHLASLVACLWAVLLAVAGYGLVKLDRVAENTAGLVVDVAEMKRRLNAMEGVSYGAYLGEDHGTVDLGGRRRGGAGGRAGGG